MPFIREFILKSPTVLPSGCNTSYKPSSVSEKRSMIIYLRRLLPNGLGISPSATQGDMSGKRSLCGVASDRVYICTQLPVVPVSSYLAFPSLPLKAAVYFCCTFPEVTLGGRYPLSCPVKLGLSSR